MSAVERVEDRGLTSAPARESDVTKGASAPAAGPSPDAPQKKSRGVKLRPLLAQIEGYRLAQPTGPVRLVELDHGLDQ